MFKKLLFSGLAFMALTSVSNAQGLHVNENPKIAPPIESRKVIDFSQQPAVGAKTNSVNAVTDTLWYFFNKHRLRNPANTGFFYLLSPMTQTLDFSHWGSIFLNTGTISVTGLECIAARHENSPSANVTIRMYLANVGSTGPTFPPVDSLDVVATGTAGAFRGANFNTPRTITGDFAVLFKCIPTVVGDSVELFMSNAMTATSTSGPASARYGEGLSFIRYPANGNFVSMTNLYGTGGTDYEMQVAPRVAFSGTVSMASSSLPNYCMYQGYTFNNTSSNKFGHRQYNLNEFYRRWKPFANTTSIITPDSVYKWNFGDGSPNRYTTFNVPSLSHTFTTLGVYTVSLTLNYRNTFNYADAANFTDVVTAVKTTSNCLLDVGINEVQGLTNVNIYPNPTVNSKTTISGLNGTNTVMVFNVLGQAILAVTTEKELLSIDLMNQPNGNYFVKVTNAESGGVKVFKVINQN